VTGKTGIEPETKVIEAEKLEKGISFKTFSKTLNNKKNSYTLEIIVLPEYQEKYQERINLMLESFSLK
jgi:hypothetical protein